jgi:hypothetical protein
MKVPLVDAAVRYDCPFDGRVYILLIQNALYVPSMDYNLLPPFMMREAGLIVKDTPKIQLDDPSEEDHAITFPETGFRIPLSLWGVFSYFPTTKPTENDLVEPDEVYVLTPTRWNPHTDAYAKNEEAIMDWEGNVKPPRDREIRIVLDDVPEDEAMVSSLWVSPNEGAHIDALMSYDPETEELHTDEVYTFAEALCKRAEEGDFKMSIGSTYASDSTLLTVASEDKRSDDQSEESEESEEVQWDDMEDAIDSIMASATASFASGVSPEHLSKVWRSKEDT